MIKSNIMDVLSTVARNAAAESNVTHPVDIAHAMINAIESAAETIDVLGKKNLLR